MYLGVDGGGTKTAFALLDADGRLLARHESGSAYYLVTGLERTAAMLNAGVAETLALAGATPDAVAFAFFGLPAYGEDSLLHAALDALPGELFAPQRYRCGNDMVCSWAGSLACADGISIVAGTGSIGYGRYDGREARAGGWGELFSDEGSAYWIAREGLALFARMSDGRTPRGPLHAIFRRGLALGADLDLCAEVYSRRKGERSQLAQLARLVQQAALEGDAEANAIFEQAAHELAAIVDAVRRQLGVPADVALPVSYSGGVFNSASPLLGPFTQRLARHGGFALQEPQFEPVIGAALYAAQCDGKLPGRVALARLAQRT
ncbi:N-acetylglucosamine kinase [Massilia atriviolacea]|uniref:N-acetylglucosamine kinase n=1 Tax=Massilia atriviolacea TaxID=2495579 RepID=A0A430HTK5_9BURK|nr:BadF/BadG/BcrA/BcrD ATPase family protein [Massilia atriviolacea]RSZ60857.1 N-acetylglucosamine kinase [Massilia atriviolacea]